jgi:hypothetical protein
VNRDNVARLIADFVAMLERGETLHPQRASVASSTPPSSKPGTPS